jgi:hypothetical protein
MNTEHAINPTNEAHDERGRFKVGNRGGPGNPFARQVAALRQAILERLTPQDVQEIVGSLINLAKEGSFQAAKLLFAYGIGKPQPAPEPDRMDADEWDVYREQAPMKVEAGAVVGAGEPESHLNQVRTVRPIVSQVTQEPRPEQEEFADEQPSTNGADGDAPPSSNGKIGAPTVETTHAPAQNRKQRRAQRKRERAQRKRERARPSPNGKLTAEKRLASTP